jgi:hypothetical protein
MPKNDDVFTSDNRREPEALPAAAPHVEAVRLRKQTTISWGHCWVLIFEVVRIRVRVVKDLADGELAVVVPNYVRLPVGLEGQLVTAVLAEFAEAN